MLQKFINENIRYPKIKDLDSGFSSVRVMVEFDVDNTGTLSNYESRTDMGLTGVYNY